MSRVTLRDTETQEDVTHAAAGQAGYATLCGCSDNDDMFERVKTPPGWLIDCVACRNIFNEARKLRAKDFTTTPESN